MKFSLEDIRGRVETLKATLGNAKARFAVFSEDENRDTHIFLFLCFAFFIVMGIWSTRYTLDIFSNAEGEVVPASQLKQVQHLEGGIIREILVKEGDRITAGQPLIELESLSNEADVSQLRIRIAALRTDQVRLNAEANGEEDLVFPEDLLGEYPKIVRDARSLFRARNERHENELLALDEKIAQARQSISDAQIRIARYQHSLKLRNEQIQISEGLLEDDLTNRYNHLDLLSKRSELRGQIEEAKAGKRRAESALREALALRRDSSNIFLEEVRALLEENGRQLNEYDERLNTLEDSVKRSVLRAPVDGIVKTLRVTTRGGVVQPGASVLDIVPGKDTLIIEAKLSPGDIGYVDVGQEARISLSAAEAMRYGDIEGNVTHISPDTFVDEHGGAYYMVRISPDKAFFEKGERRYRLYPGVNVMAKIHTGQRTIADYVFDPFLGGMKSALTEQ